jgi:hypothetical protein
VDTRYFSACVERNNFTPVPLDQIVQYFAKWLVRD